MLCKLLESASPLAEIAPLPDALGYTAEEVLGNPRLKHGIEKAVSEILENSSFEEIDFLLLALGLIFVLPVSLRPSLPAYLFLPN